MRKDISFGMVAVLMAAAAPAYAAGPFDAASSLPYQAPRFDIIKDKDYQPAFEQGMRAQLAEMAAIAGNKAEPSFDNTIAAMERSGRMLERVNNTFFGVVQANTNPALDKVQTAVAPQLAAHNDAIFLDEKLFARVKALYDRRAALKLDSEALQVLTLYYRQFVHAGANLRPADKARLKQINRRDASLETAFQQKLIAAAKKGALVLDSKEQLKGLSDAEMPTTPAPPSRSWRLCAPKRPSCWAIPTMPPMCCMTRWRRRPRRCRNS
jgi:peptidyl-dipeptidase Dcp